MVNAKICVLADNVIRDAERHNISVINIAEEITPEGFPIFFQRLDYFVLWEKEENDKNEFDVDFTVKIDSDELLKNSLKIDFKGGTRNRTIMNINGIIIPRPGTLSFCFTLETGVKAEYKVKVNPVKAVAEIKS